MQHNYLILIQKRTLNTLFGGTYRNINPSNK